MIVSRKGIQNEMDSREITLPCRVSQFIFPLSWGLRAQNRSLLEITEKLKLLTAIRLYVMKDEILQLVRRDFEAQIHVKAIGGPGHGKISSIVSSRLPRSVRDYCLYYI